MSYTVIMEHAVIADRLTGDKNNNIVRFTCAKVKVYDSFTKEVKEDKWHKHKVEVQLEEPMNT